MSEPPDPGESRVPSYQALLAFFRLAGELKRTPRQGWLDRGLRDVESVADHTYRMVLMAWVLGAEAGLDVDHLIKMVLVHDLPEALAGDATPYQSLIDGGLAPQDAAARWHDLLSDADLAKGKRTKTEAERVALDTLAGHLGSPLQAEVQQLWTEYESKESPEAKFASEVDKLEALLQALEYEQAGESADPASFRRTAEGYVTHPVLKTFLSELTGGNFGRTL